MEAALSILSIAGAITLGAMSPGPSFVMVARTAVASSRADGLAAALGTLHANNSNQAMDRIINFFPESRRQQLLMDLSLNLKAVISQRLIPLREGKGRAAAVEVLLNSPLISDLIFKGEIHGIKEIMKKSRELGMQTFDQALFDLYEQGRIGYEDALRFADSTNEVRLNIKLHGKESKEKDLTKGIEHLDIV